jgi:hypothetical protein
MLTYSVYQSPPLSLLGYSSCKPRHSIVSCEPFRQLEYFICFISLNVLSCDNFSYSSFMYSLCIFMIYKQFHRCFIICPMSVTLDCTIAPFVWCGKLSFDGGDCGSNKWKWDYGGVCRLLWRSLRSVEVWSLDSGGRLCVVAFGRNLSPWRCFNILHFIKFIPLMWFA